MAAGRHDFSGRLKSAFMFPLIIPIPAALFCMLLSETRECCQHRKILFDLANGNRKQRRRGDALLELIARSAIPLILDLMRAISPWTILKGSGPAGLFPKSGPQASASNERNVVCIFATSTCLALRHTRDDRDELPCSATLLLPQSRKLVAPRFCSSGVAPNADINAH